MPDQPKDTTQGALPSGLRVGGFLNEIPLITPTTKGKLPTPGQRQKVDPRKKPLLNCNTTGASRTLRL
jgi:hypothetical protein